MKILFKKDKLVLVFIVIFMICSSLKVESAEIMENKDLNILIPNKIVDNERHDVIIIPGIMGSELYSNDEILDEKLNLQREKDYRLWLNFEVNGIKNINRVLRIPENIKLLRCDKDGQSVNCISTKNIDSYGTLNAYKQIINYLEKNLGEESGVYFFPYDWRLDNKIAVEELHNFIIENKLKDIVLVGHSMGGLVAAQYINSYEDDQSVDKVITLAAPFLGSTEVPYVLDNGNVGKGLQNALIGDEVKNIMINMSSIHQLLPSKEYFDIYEGYIELKNDSDGKMDLLNYEETREILSSLGLNDKLLKNSEEFHKNLYELIGKESCKNKLFSIVGYGHHTIKEFCYEKGENLKISDLNIDSYFGDGTVSTVSACFGERLNNNHTFYAETSHSEIITNDAVKNLVLGIINDDLNTLPEGISNKIINKNLQIIKIKVEGDADIYVKDKNNTSIGYISRLLGIKNREIKEGSFYMTKDLKICYLQNDIYDITVIGNKKGKVNIDVDLLDNDKNIKHLEIKDITMDFRDKLKFSTDFTSDLKIKY